ncbi:MAG: flavin reductase [Xylophilus ampelinus]
MISTTDFRDGMSRLAGAVNVITTDGPAGRAGFTASAVCSVTDQPPTLLACMNRGSFAHRFFVENGNLCVNVLSAAQQDLSALFADRRIAMDERFARAPWARLETGAPALRGALVSFDGRIVRTHEVGTHSIFLVELSGICTGGDECSGLAYFDRAYHRLQAAQPARA